MCACVWVFLVILLPSSVGIDLLFIFDVRCTLPFDQINGAKHQKNVKKKWKNEKQKKKRKKKTIKSHFRAAAHISLIHTHTHTHYTYRSIESIHYLSSEIVCERWMFYKLLMLMAYFDFSIVPSIFFFLSFSFSLCVEFYVPSVRWCSVGCSDGVCAFCLFFILVFSFCLWRKLPIDNLNVMPLSFYFHFVPNEFNSELIIIYYHYCRCSFDVVERCCDSLMRFNSIVCRRQQTKHAKKKWGNRSQAEAAAAADDDDDDDLLLLHLFFSFLLPMMMRWEESTWTLNR